MVFTATSRAALHDAEKHWLAKFVLRVVTIVVALVAVILIVCATAQENASGYLLAIVWDFIPLGISVCWNLANIIVLLARRRPMHPGANVGVDLIIWLILIVTSLGLIVAAISQLQWDQWGYKYRDSPGYITYANGTRVATWGNACPGYSITCADLAARQAEHHTLGAVELAASVFSFIALLLHFALFVWACVDTHTRRRSHINDRAAHIAQTMIAEMTARGVLPAPQRQPEEALLRHDQLEAGTEVSNDAPSRVTDARDGDAPWSQGNLGAPGNPGAPRVTLPPQAHNANGITPASAVRYSW